MIPYTGSKYKGKRDCNVGIHVFLRDGWRTVCVEPDRNELALGNQSDGADHSARDGDLMSNLVQQTEQVQLEFVTLRNGENVKVTFWRNTLDFDVT